MSAEQRRRDAALTRETEQLIAAEWRCVYLAHAIPVAACVLTVAAVGAVLAA